MYQSLLWDRLHPFVNGYFDGVFKLYIEGKVSSQTAIKKCLKMGLGAGDWEGEREGKGIFKHS